MNGELREEKGVVWENLSSGKEGPQGSMEVDRRIPRECVKAFAVNLNRKRNLIYRILSDEKRGLNRSIRGSKRTCT